MTERDMLPRTFEPSARPFTADAIIRRAHALRRRRAARTAAIVAVSIGAVITSVIARVDTVRQPAKVARYSGIDGAHCPLIVPSRTEVMAETAPSIGVHAAFVVGKPTKLTICQYSAAVGGKLLYTDLPYSPDRASRPGIGLVQNVINQAAQTSAEAPSDCSPIDGVPATLALFQSDDGSIQVVLIAQGDACHELIAPGRSVIAPGAAPIISSQPGVGTPPVPTPGNIRSQPIDPSRGR